MAVDGYPTLKDLTPEHFGASAKAQPLVLRPWGVQAILEEFDEFLELQCLRSAHTRRAYSATCVRCSATSTPGVRPGRIEPALLRSWLASGATAGAARTTLAVVLVGQNVHGVAARRAC